ncbi:restriction endonuclease subunit S [Aeromonas caviae]|uniref:restriction endonuclease subunit S n=1 Tax=Aeromonas caviae TaxID=648 RepID=UPI002B46F8E1|nr:restriction endonuclease subunit S [Aeromonas caviae]
MSEVVAAAQQGLAGKYKPYPEYKDSGVEWLQLCPSSWETKALKYIVSCNDEVLSESTDPDMEFEYIDIGGVSSSEGITRTESMRFSGSPSRARRIVRQGDIIVSTVRTYLEAIAPISLEFDGKIASTGFAVLRPKYLLSGFAQYALRARHFIDSVVARSTGVSYPAINSSELIDIKIIVPSLKEQQTIAAFLDYETARIDRLIAQQQRLIELLKEKRQAVISHAVTKGLNPDAPMKDSGIEWLGQVPEHWVVTKLSRLVFMQEGPGLRTWQFTDEGTRVICVTNITESGIDFSRLQKYISTEEYMSSYRHFKVKQGDILISSSGNSWGKVAEYHGNNEVILNTSTIRVNVLSGNPLVRGFIKLYLQSVACREQLGLAMTGACQPNFGPSHLKEVFSPVPPQNEQNEIVRYITDATSTFARTIGVCEATVALLQERRTAVISAAVTGKIDLRGWTPPTDSEVAA